MKGGRGKREERGGGRICTFPPKGEEIKVYYTIPQCARRRGREGRGKRRHLKPTARAFTN